MDTEFKETKHSLGAEEMNKTLISEKLTQYSEQFKGYGVNRIGVFGSFVREEETQESDIDILVEFEKGLKTFDNYMDLKFFLEELFGTSIDLVTAEALKPQLKEQILKEVEYAERL